jgi:mercuric ion transport protein
MPDTPNNRLPIALAVLAAIGASACCFGPLLLLGLGISGAWIANLTSMEPYRLYFTVATLIMLAFVFRKLYLIPQQCEEDTVCANSNVIQNQRIIFWFVSVILIAMITFPYYAEYIID